MEEKIKNPLPNSTLAETLVSGIKGQTSIEHYFLLPCFFKEDSRIISLVFNTFVSWMISN